jgi:hypothetical protein
MGWFFALVAATACSLNPPIEPPSADTAAKGTGGIPMAAPGAGGGGNAFGAGGEVGIGGFNSGAGGYPPGAGGSIPSGSGGASAAGTQGMQDASVPRDGAAPADAGPRDAGHDGKRR